MSAETQLCSLERLAGMCVASFHSFTRSSSGDVCMEAKERLVLIRDSDCETLRRRIHGQYASIRWKPLDCQETVASWTLGMRFNWDPLVWKNNIHTDGYARSLGFRRALVEGHCVADLVFLSVLDHEQIRYPVEFRWAYHGALETGLSTILVRKREGDANRCRYQLCDSKCVDGHTWLRPVASFYVQS